MSIMAHVTGRPEAAGQHQRQVDSRCAARENPSTGPTDRTVILIADQDSANFDPLPNFQRTNGLIRVIGWPTNTFDERTIYLPPYFKC